MKANGSAYDKLPVRGATSAGVQELLRIQDASELLKTASAPIRYAVPGWLPEGLTLLVANPKIGKSTLILQVAVAMANGGEFWGEGVPKSKVLMIDLETNERRLRRKLEAAGVTSLEPGMLQYATNWPRGLLGVDRIAQVVDQEDIKLVVIDTLQRFRDSSAGKQNAYAADYDAIAPLQELCRRRPGLSIVCVHHKRKADSADPIDSINGSAAIAGSADNIWILSRKAGEYVLTIQGRDWDRDEDEFRLIRNDGGWELSDAPRYSHTQGEVLRHLEMTGGMKTQDLAAALSISRQAALKRASLMRDEGLIQFKDGAWYVS